MEITIEVELALMYHFELVLVQEFGSVHGHHHFGDMAQFALILGKRTYHIPQPTRFSNRIALGAHVNYFHELNMMQSS